MVLFGCSQNIEPVRCHHLPGLGKQPATSWESTEQFPLNCHGRPLARSCSRPESQTSSHLVDLAPGSTVRRLIPYLNLNLACRLDGWWIWGIASSRPRTGNRTRRRTTLTIQLSALQTPGIARLNRSWVGRFTDATPLETALVADVPHASRRNHIGSAAAPRWMRSVNERIDS